MNAENWSLHIFYFSRILKNVEPIHDLNFMDNTQAAFESTLQNYATHAAARSKVNGGHAAHRLPHEDDFGLINTAVIREEMESGINVRIKIGLARNTAALAIATIFVGEDVNLQLSAHV
eukprot:CAMPEP_0169291194 /NCGR_PEP_ID=MMETSP1016-20121227/62104_1 /TAXON_ID=342587 /ORGANISM="Karlodinium micrum, Strain CCMP2283" /LENGTH=118 /DNA_ID=CAMNT_0009381757 /DNA_START=470 /DNA_END=823 /DNA_ORIENTATION=-